ncbi:MAG: hypothetical protein ACXABY_08940 [Candidatus Thorarchaeota archaeon]|jgi:hypothetical protein
MGSKSKQPSLDPAQLAQQAVGVSQQFQKQRQEDLTRGRERASEVFADVQAGDIEDIISRRREQLAGLTPEEQQALEQQGIGGIQQAEQGALRQLRGAQGAAGVRGAQAGAQQADILSQGVEARGDLQRDILIQDISQRRTALDQLEKSLTGERTGAQARELGEASLGASDRGAAIGLITGAKQAESRGGKK